MYAAMCRYAELLGDNRSFTAEEQELFDSSAEFAYESFRDKAAEVCADKCVLAASCAAST